MFCLYIAEFTFIDNHSITSGSSSATLADAIETEFSASIPSAGAPSSPSPLAPLLLLSITLVLICSTLCKILPLNSFVGNLFLGRTDN